MYSHISMQHPITDLGSPCSKWRVFMFILCVVISKSSALAQDDDTFGTSVIVEEYPSYEEMLDLLKPQMSVDEWKLSIAMRDIGENLTIANSVLAHFIGKGDADGKFHIRKFDSMSVLRDQIQGIGNNYPRKCAYYDIHSRSYESVVALITENRIVLMRKGHSVFNDFFWYVYAEFPVTLLGVGTNPSKEKVQELLDWAQESCETSQRMFYVNASQILIAFTPFLSGADQIAEGNILEGIEGICADTAILLPYIGGASKVAKATRIVIATVSGGAATSRIIRSGWHFATGEGSVVDGANIFLSAIDLVLSLRGLHTDLKSLLPRPSWVSNTTTCALGWCCAKFKNARQKRRLKELLAQVDPDHSGGLPDPATKPELYHKHVLECMQGLALEEAGLYRNIRRPTTANSGDFLGIPAGKWKEEPIDLKHYSRIYDKWDQKTGLCTKFFAAYQVPKKDWNPVKAAEELAEKVKAKQDTMYYIHYESNWSNAADTDIFITDSMWQEFMDELTRQLSGEGDALSRIVIKKI